MAVAVSPIVTDSGDAVYLPPACRDWTDQQFAAANSILNSKQNNLHRSLSTADSEPRTCDGLADTAAVTIAGLSIAAGDDVGLAGVETPASFGSGAIRAVGGQCPS
jgi:hypothetical protein